MATGPPGSSPGGDSDTPPRRKERLEHAIGTVLRKAGLYGAVAAPYFFVHFVYYRVRDLLAGRYLGSPLATGGFYRVEPTHESIEPFWCYLDVGEKHRRRRVTGKYEPDIIQVLGEHVSTDSTFWEVGAYSGYFSLAFADRAQDVVAFDVNERLLRKLEESAELNGFDNIVTVNTRLGIDDTLDHYLDALGRPDVILMDIEGWEYDVLRSAPELLDAKPVMVIELHSPGTGWGGSHESYHVDRPDRSISPEDIDPDGVIELLVNEGYSVSEVYRRRRSNWHIVATP